MKKQTLGLMLFAVLIGAVLLIISLTTSSSFGPTSSNIAFAQDDETCVQIVEQAFSETGLNCANLGPGDACYGAGDAQLANIALGETVSLVGLDKIESKKNGVVVANLQSNRDVISIGDVVMILIGNTTVEDFQQVGENVLPSITLHTDSDSDCLSAPPSSLVLQSAHGTTFDIVVNGAQIRAASTVFIRNTNENTLRISVGEGTAVLFPLDINKVTIPAGYSVDVPLDEEGMAIGSWDDWGIGEHEIVQFTALEKMPSNILNDPYSGPSFFQGSGVGGVPPVIVPPPANVPPVMVPFPVINLRPRGRGADLPINVAFNPITVGAAVCSANSGILFHGDASDHWDIYRLRNTAINNVSRGERDDIQPTYSQDYEHVAFTSNRVSPQNWEIYIAKADGSEVQRITWNTANEINPVWGPVGKIIFESVRDNNWELYMVDVADSRDLTRLTEDEGNDVNPFWSENANTIFFQSDRDGDYEIYSLNIDSGELTQITDNDVQDSFPAVSHDGEMLAWIQADSRGIENLWMKDLTTGEEEQLSDLNASVAGPAFAPDGSYIAFHSNVDGDFDVFALSLTENDDAGDPLIKNLTDNQDDNQNDGFDDRSPTFRCDSPGVVVFHSDRIENQDDIFQVSVLPLSSGVSEPTRLTHTDEDFEIYPLGDPREESTSRNGRLPQ